MKYSVIADTDIGISKESNQDSILVKHAASPIGEVLLAVICDGMGGLSKGELASASVVREFSNWFDRELPKELVSLDMNVIGGKWELLLKDLNIKILEYGKKIGVNLGTTFSGILLIDDKYLIGHVGDSRVYQLSPMLRQLTKDQTVIAREIEKGTMTYTEAQNDPRKNMLLQCVGASKVVTPQIVYGKVENGFYLLCSDGFRHKVTPEEIEAKLSPAKLKTKNDMKNNIRYLIDLDKSRDEKDNISAILIKVE
jgi:serine/threonine protein phosphatase PrpC